MKLPISQKIILDGVETRIFLSDFAQHLYREDADIPDFYLIIFAAAGVSPTLVLNQNANAKEGRSWVPFKI